MLAGTGALGLTGLAAGCAGGGEEATTAAYPSDTIEFVIPYNPGGGADPAGREFASQLARRLGGGTAVINVPGGNESIGISRVAHAPRDGYTLGMGTTGGLLGQPVINPQLGYDKDSVLPLARLTATPYALLVSADSEFESLDHFVDEARGRPGEILVSAPTLTGNTAFVLYFLADQAGIDVRLVPTTGGSGEAALEVLSGRLHAYVANAQGQRGLVQSGDMRALAYTGDVDYSAHMPGAVALTDAGYDIPFTSDYTAFAPKGLPEDTRETLMQAVADVGASEEWKAWGDAQGAVPEVLVGEELARFIEESDAAVRAGIELSEGGGGAA